MSCCSCKKKGYLFYTVRRVSCLPASLFCAENDIISPSSRGFYLWSETHTHTVSHAKWMYPHANTHMKACTHMHTHTQTHTQAHTHTKPQVYNRWRRLIASALHHEWQQEVMNALLYGRRGNEYVGYLSLCLKSFPPFVNFCHIFLFCNITERFTLFVSHFQWGSSIFQNL